MSVKSVLIIAKNAPLNKHARLASKGSNLIQMTLNVDNNVILQANTMMKKNQNARIVIVNALAVLEQQTKSVKLVIQDFSSSKSLVFKHAHMGTMETLLT